MPKPKAKTKPKELSSEDRIKALLDKVHEDAGPDPIFVGIDPGAEGAIAFLYKQHVAVVDIPTFEVPRAKGAKTVFDNQAILALFRLLNPVRELVTVVLEQALVQVEGKGSEGEGKKKFGASAYTAYRVGCSYGMWPLFLAGKKYAVMEVLPLVWKKRMGLMKPRTDNASRDAQAAKNQSRALALRLFPRAKDSISRVKDHNRAEAILLAEYGRRERMGETPKRRR